MKKVFLATTAIASTVVFAGSANALTDTYTAAIDVVDALGMSNTVGMDFGKIATPGASSVVVHLTQAGGEGGSNTATMIDTTSRSTGTYKITGSSNTTIQISAADAAGVAGFTFTELNCKYDGGAETDIIDTSITSGAAPTSSGKNLVCGAKVTVASSVTDGTYAPDIAITVDYE